MKPIKANLLIGFGLILLFGSLFSGIDFAFSQQQFIRGDADGDCLVGVSDITFMICYLFGTPIPPCRDAADVNDDGNIDVGDYVRLVDYIFKGGPPPHPPFPNPGPDPTPDNLDCAAGCVSPIPSNLDSLIVPSISTLAGEAIEVPILVKNTQELMGYQVYLEFNPTVLEATDVDTMETATGMAGAEEFSFQLGSNFVEIWCTIDCTQLTGIPAGRDILVKILFQVNQSATCDTTLLDLINITGPPFKGNLFNYDNGKVYPVLVDGRITSGAVYPEVNSITDVGNDQGRQVRVRWSASCFDDVGLPQTITQYSVWRRADTKNFDGWDTKSLSLSDIKAVANMDEMLAQVSQAKLGDQFLVGDKSVWVFITTVPAMQFEQYAYDAPTECDSTDSGGMCWSVFFVAAHTSNPTVHYDSDPDSGYSLDNIPPLPIRDLQINPSSWFTLEWTVPGEYSEERPISNYDIRYNTVPVGVDTQAWWNSAIACSGSGFFNYAVGETDSLKVAMDCGCHPNVYFAIKGLDDRPNTSPISNFYHFICGDANNSGVVEVGDIMILINYLYRGGSPPQPMAKGDANCNEVVEVGDVLLLINYLFRSGPSPCGS